MSYVSFADSVRTVYGALLNGASLYPFHIKAEGMTPLANWVIHNEITVYRSVPTTFRTFVRTLTGGKRFPQLRLIYLAGEPVYKKDVELYRKHFSDSCILVNRLGTGESLTFRWFFMDKNTSIEGVHVPVGFAVPDKDIVLLDKTQNAADGAHVGEIGVQSCYLSPGYWKRSDLTQAAFLTDPEGGNSRIYRTGDIGRISPDGCLVHLGRKDHQVKIRGHRVEVAEIEMALLDLPAVMEAVVVAREDHASDQQLVAYLVIAGTPSPSAVGLRRFLTETLPDYMIPSAFVQLDALPLLSNGKLNRRELPAPGPSRPELGNSFVPPRTTTEMILAHIWAHVLGLEEVGIDDRFLDLGGQSLHAMRIVSRVHKMLHVEVPMRCLFEAPTVALMAVVLARRMNGEPDSEEAARLIAKIE